MQPTIFQVLITGGCLHADT